MSSLATYLTKSGETQAAFAERAGLSPSVLSRILTGKRAPTADVVEKVEKASDGKVTPNDLFDAYREARQPPADKAAA